MYMYHIFFIHSSINGHRLLPCLGYCKCAAMNIGVHLTFQITSLFSSDICPGLGLLDHMVALFLVF